MMQEMAMEGGPYKRKIDAEGMAPGASMVTAAVPGLSLSLTDEETALFALLMEVVAHFKLKCVLRVAGGWVRDRIMVRDAPYHSCTRNYLIPGSNLVASNPERIAHLCRDFHPKISTSPSMIRWGKTLRKAWIFFAHSCLNLHPSHPKAKPSLLNKGMPNRPKEHALTTFTFPRTDIWYGFREKVVEFMHASGRSSQVGSIGVIKSNPDQSKHLETATVRVLGFEVDFVNLRAEVKVLHVRKRKGCFVVWTTNNTRHIVWTNHGHKNHGKRPQGKHAPSPACIFPA
jgi:hypothetical protein